MLGRGRRAVASDRRTPVSATAPRAATERRQVDGPRDAIDAIDNRARHYRERSTDPYRGADRRHVITGLRPLPGAGFVVAAAIVVVASAFAVADTVSLGGLATQVGLTPNTLEPSTVPLVSLHLHGAAFSVALSLTAMCLARWRLVGDAAMLWLGVAMLFYGLFTVGLGSVLRLNRAATPFETGGIGAAAWMVASAAHLVVIALVVAALRSPEVDTRLRAGRIALGAAMAALALAGVLLAIPVTSPWTAGSPTADVGLTPGPALWRPAIAILWALLAGWSLWRGLRRPHPLLPWFGLLFLALSVVAFTGGPPSAPGSLLHLEAPLVRLLGLLAATVGAARGITDAFETQGRQLLASVTSERTAVARAEADNASQAERAHEASNALLAIEGAVQTLQRYQDQLEPDERGELSAAIGVELHRLQGLVSCSDHVANTGRFRVTEALAAIVTCARSRGSLLVVDVPSNLVAIGQPAATSQVLLNLFENARRYAGGEVTVRAGLEDDEVVIRVEDHGPGIAASERERIFSRGARGSAAAQTTGSGLGLYVSARLMHDQGGRLRVEDRSGPGACFAVVLPGFRELPLGGRSDEVLDEAEQGTETSVDRRLTLVSLAGDGDGPAVGSDLEDGVSDDVTG